jgi:hypothetical protein
VWLLSYTLISGEKWHFNPIITMSCLNFENAPSERLQVIKTSNQSLISDAQIPEMQKDKKYEKTI